MPPTDLSSYSFLIVDDVRTTRIQVLNTLKSLGEPVTFHAENGHDAISMLLEKASGVDCIISDFNMPIMHGLMMVKMIRTGHHQIRRDIPVLMLTGHGDRNLLGISMALDINAFMLKPVNKAALFERLVRMFEVQQSESNWIKPVEAYNCIDVDSSIRELLDKPSLDSESIRPDAVAKAIARPKKVRDLNILTRVTLSGHAPSGRSAEPSAQSPTNKRVPMKCFPLEGVPLNATLAQDLYGSRGKKLLSANMKITKSILDRLRDIKALGEPVGDIWIQVQK